MTKKAFLKKRGPVKPAAAAKTPLAVVKEKFGGKAALAQELATRLDRAEGETVEQLAGRLAKRKNSQLLALYAVTETVKEKFGGDKSLLVNAAARAAGHGNDKDYINKISTYAVPRLVDMLNRKA